MLNTRTHTQVTWRFATPLKRRGAGHDAVQEKPEEEILTISPRRIKARRQVSVVYV